MAKLTNKDILNAIADMSVMDVVELVSAMEEKFGVSATAVTPVAVVADADNTVVEKDEFDVMLTSFGEKKLLLLRQCVVLLD